MILFLWIQYRKVILYLGILLCFLILSISICRADDATETENVFALNCADKVILVDAGHGGFDGGASGNGVIEKDVNLEVALKLREYIEQNGGVCILTRDKDESTAKKDEKGKKAKKTDLEERKKLADLSEADIFISIHMNEFQNPKYSGAQVFYGDCDGSKELGEYIQMSLKNIIDKDNNRVAKKTDGKVFVLTNTKIPSVIVECGFLSNPYEAKQLKTTEYQQKLAWAIYMGIVEYFE